MFSIIKKKKNRNFILTSIIIFLLFFISSIGYLSYIYHDDQSLKKAEYDTNNDGKADRWEIFDSSGKLKKIQLDRNFDGKIDLTQKK